MTFHYTDWFIGIIQQTTRIWLLLSLCLVFSWLFSLVFQPMSSTHFFQDDFPPPIFQAFSLKALEASCWLRRPKINNKTRKRFPSNPAVF